MEAYVLRLDRYKQAVLSYTPNTAFYVSSGRPWMGAQAPAYLGLPTETDGLTVIIILCAVGFRPGEEPPIRCDEPVCRNMGVLYKL